MGAGDKVLGSVYRIRMSRTESLGGTVMSIADASMWWEIAFISVMFMVFVSAHTPSTGLGPPRGYPTMVADLVRGFIGKG
jgi:hypothetical protein